MPRRNVRWLAAGLALVVGACGNGPATPAPGDPGPATSSTTAAPTTVPSTTTQPETTTTTSLPDEPEEAPGPTADVVVDVEVVGGTVVNDPGRVQAQAGDEVLIVVRSDTADEVHVHGYDVFGEIEPGTPLEMRFTADIPGIYEVELEGSHLLLFELQVNG